jgi:phytoene synthase
MTPDEYCAERAARSGSSFYYSFLFLPPAQRRAMIALYAYCREVDDVVDDATDLSLARTRLAWWRGEIAAACGAGVPQHPVARALAPVIAQHSLPRSELELVIDGMEMDLDRNRYATRTELETYCHRVAGVVGLLSARIFGYRTPATLDYAALLGRSLQLINIIRDVGEDARRNRLYLPLDELARFGVREDDVIARRHRPGFTALIGFQIARARETYERALAILPAGERRAQRGGLVMGAIYRATLDEIERDGCRVLERRVSLTPLRKLWIAWKTWVTA